MRALVGILLAAGAGRRFDAAADGAKLMAPRATAHGGNTPVAVLAARAMRPAVDVGLVVVPGRGSAHHERLAQLLAAEGWLVVRCAAATDVQGTGASIAAGVAHSPADAAGWLVGLADMPDIQVESALRVAAAIRRGAVTAAAWHADRRGHPVGFAASCRSELMLLKGDEGARSVLLRHQPERIEVDDPGVLFDVDTPADLDRHLPATARPRKQDRP